MEEFSDRLKKLIGDKSRLSFARACDVSDGAVKGWLERGQKPSIDKALIIAKICDVSLEWLVSGEGPMRPYTSSSDAEGDVDADASMISQLEVEASAGGGSVVDSELIKGKIAFKRKWLEERELDERYLNVISVRGDSMEPTLYDGQLILVNRKDIRPRAGIYVLNLGGDVLVKRVQRLFNGDLKIASDNPLYDPEIIPADRLEDVRVIGRVVWKGGLDI